MEGQSTKREGRDGWKGGMVDEALNLDCIVSAASRG